MAEYFGFFKILLWHLAILPTDVLILRLVGAVGARIKVKDWNQLAKARRLKQRLRVRHLPFPTVRLHSFALRVSLCWPRSFLRRGDIYSAIAPRLMMRHAYIVSGQFDDLL